MNAPNMNATQKGEVNKQHKNVAKLVVQRNPTTLSTMNDNQTKGSECL